MTPFITAIAVLAMFLFCPTPLCAQSEQINMILPARLNDHQSRLDQNPVFLPANRKATRQVLVPGEKKNLHPAQLQAVEISQEEGEAVPGDICLDFDFSEFYPDKFVSEETVNADEDFFRQRLKDRLVSRGYMVGTHGNCPRILTVSIKARTDIDKKFTLRGVLIIPFYPLLLINPLYHITLQVSNLSIGEDLKSYFHFRRVRAMVTVVAQVQQNSCFEKRYVSRWRYEADRWDDQARKKYLYKQLMKICARMVRDLEKHVQTGDLIR